MLSPAVPSIDAAAQPKETTAERLGVRGSRGETTSGDFLPLDTALSETQNAAAAEKRRVDGLCQDLVEERRTATDNERRAIRAERTLATLRDEYKRVQSRHQRFLKRLQTQSVNFGQLRDEGREVFYSPSDPETENVAAPSAEPAARCSPTVPEESSSRPASSPYATGRRVSRRIQPKRSAATAPCDVVELDDQGKVVSRSSAAAAQPKSSPRALVQRDRGRTRKKSSERERPCRLRCGTRWQPRGARPRRCRAL